MRVLVTGGTGTVGSQVVRQLASWGADVSVLTRDPDGATARLPTGVGAVAGSLLEPGTVRSVFDGMDSVFLLSAVSPTEAHEGLMAVIGMQEAGVKRVVYLSVHNADDAPHLPHFGAKLPVEIAIKRSGMAHTILRPNHFFQNDLWFKDAMLEYGVYPQPLGDVGLSRVDVRDIAVAAANALTQGGHEGQTYNLVGPGIHTGPSTAEVWSNALGKPVAYGGDDLDSWEQQALAFLPPVIVFDLRHMFEYFQRNGLKATPKDLERQTALLGRAPCSLEEYASETAEAWT